MNGVADLVEGRRRRGRGSPHARAFMRGRLLIEAAGSGNLSGGKPYNREAGLC